MYKHLVTEILRHITKMYRVIFPLRELVVQGARLLEYYELPLDHI